MHGREHRFTKENVAEMIALRKAGWSFPKIGRKFKCDHTTIIYWCNKNGIKIEKKTKKVKIPIRGNYMSYKPPEGKTYKDYLIAEQKRVLGKLAFLIKPACAGRDVKVETKTEEVI